MNETLTVAAITATLLETRNISTFCGTW